MPRRKQIKDIAYGLLNSFTSRNNDVNGYWGIGKLFALMENSNNYCIQINLLSKSMIPGDNEFERLIDEFSTKLRIHLKRIDLTPERLVQARIIVTGYPNERSLLTASIAPHRINCLVDLRDEAGTRFAADKNIWCRKHDPQMESRSSRQHLDRNNG